MDIVAARTFLEIVKTGSFIRAAANLNITQTAVSARVRVLEEQLDRQLFIRNKAGARLTPAGDQFLRYATTLVQVWERARHDVAMPVGRENVITVGGEHSVWDPLLRDWLVWMKSECSDVAIRTQIDVPERLIDQVQEGIVDLAVLYAPPARAGLVAELLQEEALVAVTTDPAAGVGARLYPRGRRKRLFPDGGRTPASRERAAAARPRQTALFLLHLRPLFAEGRRTADGARPDRAQSRLRRAKVFRLSAANSFIETSNSIRLLGGT